MSKIQNPKPLSFASLRLSDFALILLITLGFVSIYLLSNFLEHSRAAMPEGYEDADLAVQGHKLRGFSLGAEGLLADVYWMRSLQYLGDKILSVPEGMKIDVEDLTALRPRLLYPYLDNATDLDPHFMAAYSFGATVLPAIDPQKAVTLTEKGIANNPDAWRLYQNLGYIYWRMQDYDKAADVYARGSQIADSPPFMKMMAAAMKVEGGSRETARRMYRQMLDQSDDQQTRTVAEMRLMEIDSLEERDTINTTLAAFQKTSGRCVSGFAELLPLLKDIKLPENKDLKIDKANNVVDPTGAPYALNREKCTVEIDPKTSRIPIR